MKTGKAPITPKKSAAFASSLVTPGTTGKKLDNASVSEVGKEIEPEVSILLFCSSKLRHSIINCINFIILNRIYPGFPQF